MSLACRLLGHKADPGRARWNRDICFGKCVRCSCDLVRSGNGSWQVPRGYRVVWRAAEKEEREPVPPHNAGFAEPEAVEAADMGQLEAPAAALVEEVSAPVEEQPSEELHAQHEIALEDDQGGGCTEPAGMFEWPLELTPTGEIDTYVERALESPPPAQEPTVGEPRSLVIDFMDDQSGDLDFDWEDVPARSQLAARG